MIDNQKEILPKEATCVVAFDLDDTLYAERDFACSAYREVAELFSKCAGGSKQAYSTMCLRLNMRHNPFETLLRLKGAPGIDEILNVYRDHRPTIALRPGAEEVLRELKSRGVGLALITDGRSLTQRNKIAALGLDEFFPDEAVFISGEQGADKLESKSFEAVERLFPGARFFYVGDNPVKDFLIPNSRGWCSVLLMDRAAANVHPQLPHPPGGEPRIFIDSLSEIPDLINTPNYG